MKRFVLALAAIALLGGCSILRGHHRPTTPTVGQRIPVLGTESNIEADPTLADVPVTIPGPNLNPDWPQPGGNPSKSIGHVALGPTPTQIWSVSIGRGDSAAGRLAAEPVVADGRIYTIDTMAQVRAYAADTGALIWQHEVRGAHSRRATLYGGGVSYDSGRLYVTNGSGDVACLEAATGNQVWIVKPGGPLRAAPTIGNDTVWVLSQDNQLYALNIANGELRWQAAGSFELSGVFGAASPAFAQSTLVAGYASGELTAYRYENGQVTWQDALARTGISTTVGQLSDIDADPVIENGRVFAIGQGGRMVAVELITGQRVWELNAAGLSTPTVAGEWVFVVTDRAQLLAVARSSGKVRWISQLPRWRNEHNHSGPIFWRGPVLAGNRLVLASSTGQIVFASPVDGRVVQTIEHRTPISLPPIVANNTLYILDDTGRLTAYR